MAHTFKFPFNALIVGNSQAGKSTWLKRFLANVDKMIVGARISEVVFCYGVSQGSHQELHEICPVPVRLFEGIPELDDISTTNSEPKLVILDDLSNQLNKNTSDMVLRGSHHRNLGLFILSQTLFSRNAVFREISLNSHYICIFSSPREKAQIATFARQLDPSGVPFIMAAYKDATKKAYSYLLFDLKADTQETLRYCTKIFPDEQTIYYLPRKYL